MPEINGWRDPFDVPAHLIPPAVIYQWCAKEQRGKPDPNYQKMLEAGWIPVPRLRHEQFFGDKYQGDNGSIQYGGQVLMERPRMESHLKREREVDAAFLQAGNGRTVAVDTTISIKLTAEELRAAEAVNMTGSQYAANRLVMVAHESDPATCLQGVDGAWRFAAPRATVLMYRSRWRALDWLFKLISRVDMVQIDPKEEWS